MKSLYTKALAVLAALSIGGTTLSYDWQFVNLSKKVVVIEVKLLATDDVFLRVVAPGHVAPFEWHGWNPRSGFCLREILMREYIPYMVATNFPGTNSTAIPTRVVDIDGKKVTLYDQDKIDGGSQSGASDGGKWFYALDRFVKGHEAVINWIPNASWGMFDEKMSAAADKLASGVGTSIGAAADAAMAVGSAAAGAPGATDKVSATNMLAGLGGVVGGIMSLMSRSKCMSRNFKIMDTQEGGLQLFTLEQ